MKDIKTVTIDDIEKHLLDLGGGNHKDNMARLVEMNFHYRVKLEDTDFYNLAILRNDETKAFVSRGDRRLRTAGQSALSLFGKAPIKFSGNWDLLKIINKTDSLIDNPNDYVLADLVLRDAKPGKNLLDLGEKTHPEISWYLQDGCHRALGYMMYMLLRFTSYKPQCALVGTNTKL